jgi:hypothetical protein
MRTLANRDFSDWVALIPLSLIKGEGANYHLPLPLREREGVRGRPDLTKGAFHFFRTLSGQIPGHLPPLAFISVNSVTCLPVSLDSVFNRNGSMTPDTLR